MTRRESKRGGNPVLPGFGPKTSSALARVGIKTHAALRARNPYELYRELKGRDASVNLNFLYGIIAAQEGCHWREVQKSRRLDILLVLEDMGLAPGQGPGPAAGGQ